MTVRAIPGAVKTQWLWYSSTRRLVIIWGKTRRVLEASMANVMSPRPSRAVISQRSRTLTAAARLVWVSMARCYSVFFRAAHHRHTTLLIHFAQFWRKRCPNHQTF
jgi:hypothetical protein